MRLIIAMSLFAASAVAQAQTSPTPPTDGAAMPNMEKMQEMKGKFDERFAAADADHDGKLSLTEAQGKMPAVAKNFQAIDTDHDGFVTKPEILAFMKTKAAERKAAAPTP